MTEVRPGRVVYVGSIPYDQTEEQVLDIFRSVGPVANFKLVFDKDTGKSKGFGFVEYHDVETAASAVRNLNNFQTGSRSIRVDFSHETSISSNPNVSRRLQESSLPSLPSGTPLATGVSAAEAITKTINAFPREKTLQILSDLKFLINNNTTIALDLFKEYPQLAYAAVQSMLALHLVQPDAISTIIDQHHVQQQEPRMSTPVPNEPQQQAPSKPDPQQAAIIQQLLQLSDEQVKALPQSQQDAIYLLRERVRKGEIQI